MLLIITSTGDMLFGFINIDDLERPWTLKILILSDFLAIFGCKRVNCDEMDEDRLRLPANRNCCRLSRISWALLKLLVEFIDILKQRFVNPLLHNTAANIVESTVIRAVRGYISGVMKFAYVFFHLNLCCICSVFPCNEKTEVKWARNLKVIWWPVVYRMFVPKTIQIYLFISKLLLIMSSLVVFGVFV